MDLGGGTAGRGRPLYYGELGEQISRRGLIRAGGKRELCKAAVQRGGKAQGGGGIPVRPGQQHSHCGKVSAVLREPGIRLGKGIYGLDADIFLSIVQRDTVAAVIVAALMYQPPHLAILAIVHNGDGGSFVFLHVAAFQTGQWVMVIARVPPSCGAGPVGLTDWLPCGAVRRPSIHPA